MKSSKIILPVLLLISFNTLAELTSIKGVDLVPSKTNEKKLAIKYMGNSVDSPELLVKNNTIEVKIPSAILTQKISKTIEGVQITASQIDRETVKILATSVTGFSGNENLVNINLKNGVVEVNFPFKSQTARKPSIVAESKIVDILNKDAEKLDESYLEKIEKEAEIKVAKNEVKPETKSEVKTEIQNATDRVSLAMSSTAKEKNAGAKVVENKENGGFSIAGYVGKFVAFLSLMILGFYGVLTMFKKGVIKKGKLGFLHSTKLVDVLSTTHVAPKKSLLMIRAHNQVFLVSNTDAGIQLISEIKDTTGIIKSSEAEVAGDNFDMNLNSASKTSKDFKLKNDEALELTTLDDMLDDFDSSNTTAASQSLEKKPVADQVKLSDQIKSKLKNLKQLQ